MNPSSLSTVAQRQLEHLREMQRAPSRCLDDLLAAAESVGDDQRIG
jgi:hypothetical protein